MREGEPRDSSMPAPTRDVLKRERAFTDRMTDPSINRDRLVRRLEDLPFQDMDGKVVIVHPARKKVLLLNEVGSRIWEILERRLTVGELVQNLLREYEVSEDQVEEEVCRFLARLRQGGLIEIV